MQETPECMVYYFILSSFYIPNAVYKLLFERKWYEKSPNYAELNKKIKHSKNCSHTNKDPLALNTIYKEILGIINFHTHHLFCFLFARELLESRNIIFENHNNYGQKTPKDIKVENDLGGMNFFLFAYLRVSNVSKIHREIDDIFKRPFSILPLAAQTNRQANEYLINAYRNDNAFFISHGITEETVKHTYNLCYRH